MLQGAAGGTQSLESIVLLGASGGHKHSQTGGWGFDVGNHAHGRFSSFSEGSRVVWQPSCMYYGRLPSLAKNILRSTILKIKTLL